MPIGIENQPLSVVKWVQRDELHANDYNPNHVAPPELTLLKVSILEDGWTQPIVARTDSEIVDGFHRWTVSADPNIFAMTDGLVPVVFLSAAVSAEQQRMSTIRHNRARGSHYVVRMSEIVLWLLGQGLTEAEISQRLQMEKDEVIRLAEKGKMTRRHARSGFNNGWQPKAGVARDTDSEE